jgi:hypothetical protein
VQQLPESVQQHVRSGKIGAWAAMKYLVPIARANRYACERLAAEIAHNQFSTGEVSQIYTAWRQGPLHVKNSIINDPKLFLRARREIEEEDPVAVRSAEELVRNLDIIGSLSRRADRQWREAAGTMDLSERGNVLLCLQQAIADLTRLSDKIERENGYVESESTDSNTGASLQGRGQSSDCTRTQSVACGSQESSSLGIEHAAADHPPGESGAVPSGDPATVCFLQGEPGPSP